MRRTSGPAAKNCHSSAIGKFITVVCTQIAKNCALWLSLNSRVAKKLMHGHIEELLVQAVDEARGANVGIPELHDMLDLIAESDD